MTKYSQQMVKGMLQLLSNCPAETAHLRKELLIAAKHILTTELRNRTSARPLRASERASEGWPVPPGVSGSVGLSLVYYFALIPGSLYFSSPLISFAYNIASLSEGLVLAKSLSASHFFCW